MTAKSKSTHGLAGRTGRAANHWTPKAEHNSELIKFFCTPAQLKRYKAAAKRAGMTLSALIRDTLDTSIL